MSSRCVIKHQSSDVFTKVKTILLIKMLLLLASMMPPDGLLAETALGTKESLDLVM